MIFNILLWCIILCYEYLRLNNKSSWVANIYDSVMIKPVLYLKYVCFIFFYLVANIFITFNVIFHKLSVLIDCCNTSIFTLKKDKNDFTIWYFRHISGPHICGDAIDIDPRHNHILTGSWCTGVTLQVSLYTMKNFVVCFLVFWTICIASFLF